MLKCWWRVGKYVIVREAMVEVTFDEYGKVVNRDDDGAVVADEVVVNVVVGVMLVLPCVADDGDGDALPSSSKRSNMCEMPCLFS
jgi:phosphatidylglycerophosphatase A